ncbi:MAG: hydroxyproline-2-epimerase [Blastopirellula sp.]|nr:MAG: hydroxyproline-2-epimerase [Blastopirellula sp.]
MKFPAANCQLQVIDSHTGGEPTRVIIDGMPDLGGGTIQDQLECFRLNHDWIRTALLSEPRGSEVMVGAILLEPQSSAATAGVIFFNNVGPLGMCGHGTIGLFATLLYLGRIKPGEHLLETAVGDVPVVLHEDGRVSLENVASARYRKDVSVEVPEIGTVVGDIAWGGNWFFLISDHNQSLELKNATALTSHCTKISDALHQQNITGPNGERVDHIELFVPVEDATVADSKNFVLCPGGQYDRSPCGTGVSGKVACLAADGKLAESALWRQQSITGSVMKASYVVRDDQIFPSITGRAFVNGETKILIDVDDPLTFGITAGSAIANDTETRSASE